MAADRGTLAGPRLGNRTPLGPAGAGAGTRGGRRRRERHPCRGTAAGHDRRRGPSVRGGNVLGGASLLHAGLPERPDRCPGGSGSRHPRAHHPGAVASFGSPRLRVASPPGVPLDHRGIPRFEARRLRPAGCEVHHEYAALLYRPGASAGRDGGGAAGPVAAGAARATRPLPGGRRVDPSQPSLGVRRHELRLPGAAE